MASPKLLRGRVSIPGNWYVITTVVVGRARLLGGSDAAIAVTDVIRQAELLGWADSGTWVVMPDHLHWLFRLGGIPLSACAQAVKSLSARAVNATLGRTGRVWQPGFHDHLVRDERQLHAIARYIVENPLRRGLAGRIEAYPHWHCPWIRGGEDLAC